MASGADSQRDWGGRLSGLYRPDESLSVYLWGSAVGKDGHPPNLVVKGVNPVTGQLDPNTYLNPDPWNDRLPAPYAASLPHGQPQAERQSYDNSTAGGQIDLVVPGQITLSYIPSYLNMSASPDYWLGAFPGNESVTYRQTTHELRAAAAPRWGTWLAGLYAYRLESHGTFTFGGFSPATGFPVSIVDLNRIAGEAGFGQATIDAGGRTRVTLGGRYGTDHRVGGGRYYDGTGLAPFDYDRDFNNFDYKLGIEHDLGGGTMVYAATQTGYQPGTFNSYASTPQASNAVAPARLKAYTGGVKSRFLDDRLQVNDEVFFYDYRGLFASAYNTILSTSQTFNAQKTEIYGNQLDLSFKATSRDLVRLSIGYLHGRYIRFDLPDGAASFDGYQMQYAPDWTVSGSYSHDFPLAAGYLRLSLGSRYEGAFFADFNHTPGGRQQPYVKSDAAVTYVAAGGWSVGAWVKNAENVAVIAATAGGSNIPPLAAGATAFLEPPRTFGLRATWDF